MDREAEFDTWIKHRPWVQVAEKMLESDYKARVVTARAFNRQPPRPYDWMHEEGPLNSV